MTDPVSDPDAAGADVDGPAVTSWFAVHLPVAEAPLRFDRVVGGHSCLTFVVTDARGARFVLRRPPLGHRLATAHDVLREHRIMSALADTSVPVPTMLGACDDTTVNGAPFYVMSHVEGAVLHDASLVPDALIDDAARRHAGEQLIDALVALHAVEPDEVGLGELSRRSGYLDRQLKRWSNQWASSKTRELPAMERLHAWLVANRPDDTSGRIVHGDFRLGNMLVGRDGTLLAILDWELCTLGDPLVDVSYLLRSWTAPDEAGPDAPNVLAPTTAGGFSSREVMAARYAERSDREIVELDYYMAFNAWRSAAIAEGVYRRYIDGNMGESPRDVERYARSVEQTAQAGLSSAGLA